MSRVREIESLKSQLARLEAEQAREEQAREALESAHAELLGRLQEADLDLEMFVRHFRKELGRIMTKIERQAAKTRPATTPPKAKRKSTVGRRRKKPAPARIRIPAGSYHNIPPDEAQIYSVNEKGARPKAVKARAEELGLEAFLQQCRIED
jgi:Fic family protein